MSENNLPVTTTGTSMVELVESSKMLYKSGLFPHIKSVEAAYAIVQYGHEIGVGPMVSLQTINFIQGKPACSGQLLLSQAYRRGVTMEVIEQTDERCELVFYRTGFQPLQSVFTIQDAAAAGLLGKDNWKKYRRDMLFWRAVAAGIRRIAPDAATGAYTPEELTGGKVIDVTAEVVNTVTGEVRGEGDKMVSGGVTAEQWKYISELRASRQVTPAMDEDLTAWASREDQTSQEASDWIDVLKELPKAYDRSVTVKWIEKVEPKAYKEVLKFNKEAVNEARLKYLTIGSLEEANDDLLKVYATHLKERIEENKAKKASKESK